MPRANWLTPVGGNSYQEEPEPKGLLGFLGAGPDFGADVGDRLGVISQILMNLGSGRGGAGIAEATAAVNSRSEARRERRKAERMVGRLADKLEDSNPEMAAAMRANTEFGMQMIGKMYESEWNSKNRLVEMEKEYGLRGTLETRKLQEEARLAAEADKANLQGLLGGGGQGGYDPWAGGGQPAPAPTPTPEGPVPTMGAGTEPSPSVIPQPVVPPQQPVPTQQAPIAEGPPLPPLSTIPQEAEKQKRLSRVLNFPVPVWGVRAIEMAGPKERDTVVQKLGEWWQGQVDAHRKTTETIQAEQRALQEKLTLPGMRQAQFLQGVTPAQGQPQTPYDPGSQPTDLQDVGILQKQGFDITDMAQMQDPQVEAQRILAGASTEAGPGAATQDIQTRLGKRREDIKAETEATTLKTTVQSSVDQMMQTIPAGPEYDQMRAELAAVPTAKDPVDQLNKWRTENRLAIQSDAQMKVADAELKIKQDAAVLANQKAEQEARDAKTQKSLKRENTLKSAFTVQRTVKQTLRALYDPEDNSERHGIVGGLTGLIPGTPRNYVNGLVVTMKAHIAEGKLALMKGETATGASGLGALTAPELAMLEADLVNLEAALASGKNIDEALKIVWNTYANVINPTGGQRLDPATPGFELREFDIQRDNEPLYQLLTEEGRLGDVVREDRAGKPRPKVTFEPVP